MASLISDMTFSDAPPPQGLPVASAAVGWPLEALPGAVAVSQKGVYLQVNAAYLRLFGHAEAAEILGRPLLDHIEAGQRDLVRARNLERERTGSGPLDYETTGLRKDGSTFPMQVHVSTVPLVEGLGTLAFITDISDRRQVLERLRQSEETFREFVAQSIDVIFELDGQGRFTFVSPAWERQFGFPGSVVLGNPFAAYVHPEDVGPCMTYLLRVLSTGQAESSPAYRVKHANGSWRWFLANGGSKVGPNGEPRYLGVARDITEDHRVQEALREAHQFNEQIIQSAREGVIVYGPDLRYRVWNPYMEQLSGIPAREVLGRHPLEIFPFLGEAGVIERLEQALAGEAVPTIEFPFLVPGTGKSGWSTDSSAPLRNAAGEIIGVIGLVADSTERRRAEQSLRENEAQLRIIFEASEAGIVLVSPQGEIGFANRKMAEMFGVSLEALIGTSYVGHLHPSEMVQGDVRMRMLIDGEIEFVSVERRYLRADGTDFWGHLSGRRLENPDGSLRALVGIVTDITKRRDAEEDQRNLQTQLHHAQKMESLGSLAGGVAHDMNNVLGAIMGLASAHIENQPVGSPTQRALGTIIKAAERGGNMLKSLLSFARQNSAEEQELDLNVILREEVRLLERTTLSKVRLVMELTPDLRLIRGDAGALTHAFMNLCVNAVDAMPENGTLTLRTRNLSGNRVEVEIQDNGTGMSKAILEKALDPFFTTKEVGKGTGLGLSIVYSTVKTYQGEMELHSEPGRGTCVTMRFPALSVAIRRAEPSGAYRTMPPRGSLEILLVDDDELIQNSMLGMLELLGHEAALATSGEEALAKLEAGLRPDVIILDMNMPGLGGMGTLPRLRALLPQVPVLLATGRADQAAQDLVQAHRFVTLLSKPFGMKELQAHLAPFVG